MTAGFYKKQDGQLLYGSHIVEGDGYVLLAQDKDTYEYPVDGWVWFDSPEEAYVYFADRSEGAVTPRQFRLALLSFGINISVIDSMLSDNPTGLVEWNFASTIERDHPLVTTLGDAMGKSAAEIDAIFELAKTL